MVSERASRLLAEVGRLLAQDQSYPLYETLLYARVEPGMIAPSIFENRANHILYRDPDLNRLCRPLGDLWDCEDPEMRWAAIEYLIRDGAFTVTYTYPDEIDPAEDTFERRDRVVRHHFGDKPIVYPAWDDDDAPRYDL